MIIKTIVDIAGHEHSVPVNWALVVTDLMLTELWCFRWSEPEQAIQTIKTPMIWDAIALILTSQ